MASVRTIGAAVGLALAGATGLAAAALRRPLPRVSGSLRLAGLAAPVQVLRDRWGVPHIYAASTHDLFVAQGYVHAQDRLWQMELQRRTGHGRLAEVFGEIALDTDRFVRVMGFSRVAQRELATLGDEARTAIEAYVHGVNSYIEQRRTRLPIEFTIVRLQPEPWQPIDVLVWGKMLAQNLARGWIATALRAQIVAAIGAERADARHAPCRRSGRSGATPGRRGRRLYWEWRGWPGQQWLGGRPEPHHQRPAAAGQ
jgi:penicillin amidase